MRRIFIALPIFLLIYIVQEAVVNQFRLPGGGFSIFLIFTVVWAILSPPEIAAFIGFIAGLMMDLSASSNGPIGQWTLLMIATCYSVAYFGAGNASVMENPLGFTLFVGSALFFTELAYVLTGALLGVASGGFGQVILTTIGISIWNLVITPIVLPIFTHLHSLIFDSRSAI